MTVTLTLVPPCAAQSRTEPEQFTFEAVGFVDTRALLDALPDPSSAEVMAAVHKVFETHREVLAKQGIAKVASVSVSEDDGQQDTDIKVFVSVTFEFTRRATLLMPTALVAALYDLAEPFCCVNGDSAVLLDDWILTDYP